jgi:hypothetical protein
MPKAWNGVTFATVLPRQQQVQKEEEVAPPTPPAPPASSAQAPALPASDKKNSSPVAPAPALAPAPPAPAPAPFKRIPRTCSMLYERIVLGDPFPTRTTVLGTSNSP